MLLNTTYRPLGLVISLVETTGIDVTYAYDDLVFAGESVLILQFDDIKRHNLHLFFNEDCIKTDADRLEHKLKAASRDFGFDILRSGNFTLQQNEGREDLSVSFSPL